MQSTREAPRGLARYLASGERIQRVCRRHPIVLLQPALVWLISVLSVVFSGAWLTQLTGIAMIDTVALFIFLGLTLVLAYKYVQWRRERYLITTKRVMLLKGIVAVKVTGVSLARVTETSFSRSLGGRLFGYGELKLDSAGEQLGLASLKYLPHPDDIYRLVSSLLFEEKEAAPGKVDPREQDTGELPPVHP